MCQPWGVAKTPVCVLGLGLIGGSILRAATAAGREAFGYNRSVEGAQAARFDGTDVTSVKGAVLDEVTAAGLQARFVGGHPMTGTAHSGWEAGHARLFTGAPWVISVDDHVDPAVWSTVMELALDCGSFLVPARSDEHDAAAAAISHLPPLLAEALAVTAPEVPLPLALAAGSFRDAPRVAGSSPDLVRAMCEGNSGQLVPAVDRAIELLSRARDSLASHGSVA